MGDMKISKGHSKELFLHVAKFEEKFNLYRAEQLESLDVKISNVVKFCILEMKGSDQTECDECRKMYEESANINEISKKYGDIAKLRGRLDKIEIEKII